MTKIKSSKIILVTAPPWFGKSFLCLFFAVAFKKSNRVYSNLDFSYNGKQFSHKIKSVEYIKNIKDSETPGLIIMDEIGGNANPRRSWNSKNIDIVTELTIYPRKKNCSVVVCAQVENLYDVYLRKTAFAEFELLQPYLYYEDGKERLLFRANILRKWEIIKYVEFELFLLLDWGYWFDSMLRSQIDYKNLINAKEKKWSPKKTKEEMSQELEETVKSIVF